MKDEKNIIEILKDLIPDEMVGNSNVVGTADMVDLDTAYKLLLVENPVPEDDFQIFSNIPPVVLGLKRDDDKYEIRYIGDDGPDFKIHTAEETKVMRARFLLLKGYYASNINRMTLPKQNEARSLYEIHFIPNFD